MYLQEASRSLFPSHQTQLRGLIAECRRCLVITRKHICTRIMTRLVLTHKYICTRTKTACGCGERCAPRQASISPDMRSVPPRNQIQKPSPPVQSVPGPQRFAFDLTASYPPTRPRALSGTDALRTLVGHRGVGVYHPPPMALRRRCTILMTLLTRTPPLVFFPRFFAIFFLQSGTWGPLLDGTFRDAELQECLPEVSFATQRVQSCAVVGNAWYLADRSEPAANSFFSFFSCSFFQR